MSTDSPAPTPPPPPREARSRTLLPGIPLQFSLRTLLIATTFFAFWCALVSQLPVAFSLLLVGAIWFIATGWLVIGIVFGRGDQRAFCIGAVLVVSSMWTGIGGQYMHGFHRLFQIGGPVAAWLQMLGIYHLFQPGSAVAAWLDLVLIGGTAAANGWFCIWARRFFERPTGG